MDLFLQDSLFCLMDALWFLAASWYLPRFFVPNVVVCELHVSVRIRRQIGARSSKGHGGTRQIFLQAVFPYGIVLRRVCLPLMKNAYRDVSEIKSSLTSLCHALVFMAEGQQRLNEIKDAGGFLQSHCFLFSPQGSEWLSLCLGQGDFQKRFQWKIHECYFNQGCSRKTHVPPGEYWMQSCMSGASGNVMTGIIVLLFTTLWSSVICSFRYLN